MDGSGFPMPTRARDVPANMAERLIVALDVPTPDKARDVVQELSGVVTFFKIGLHLFVAGGTEKLIDDLVAEGKNVFLDYKMFDIGETVRQGVARARDRGVKFITVHGDDEIMKSAVEGKGASDRLKIFSITVLTSLDDQDLRDMGYGVTVKELIELRVRRSIQCGCDGIIASAHDRPNEIRQMVQNDRLLIATPGIRSAGSASDDHKRLSTPTQAIANGADYLVMGRQIINAPDRGAMALRVIEEMKAGERESRTPA